MSKDQLALTIAASETQIGFIVFSITQDGVTLTVRLGQDEALAFGQAFQHACATAFQDFMRAQVRLIGDQPEKPTGT